VPIKTPLKKKEKDKRSARRLEKPKKKKKDVPGVARVNSMRERKIRGIQILRKSQSIQREGLQYELLESVSF